ncbi:MAG: glycosyltransferase family 9 protein [Smithella sp.]
MQRILVFHVGSIGDTILALPALHMIRHNFPSVEIHLFNSALIPNFIHHRLYDNMNLFQKMMFIPTVGNFFQKTMIRLKIIFLLFAGHYDAVFYLSYAPRRNDLILFRLLGIKTIYNCCKISSFPEIPLYKIFLKSLDGYGLRRPVTFLDFHFSNDEIMNANTAFAKLDIPSDTKPFAVGIGGKQEACHWSIEKYRKLLKHITSEYQLLPIYIGGNDDRSDANVLIQECGGYFLADSKLSLRETILFLQKCAFYVGNHTGGMHLAASSHIPCIGIFTARNKFRFWEPFGNDNIILREKIDCEGCDLTVCPFGNPSKCIDMISVDDVLLNLEKIIKKEKISPKIFDAL